MSKSEQDGKASVPKWYRRYIINAHGSEVMKKLDKIGAEHDADLAEKPDEWKKHNKKMSRGMKMANLPFLTVRLPINTFLWVYWRLPTFLKRLYWKLID